MYWINWKGIAKILGFLSFLEGIFLLTPIIIALVYQEYEEITPFLSSSLIVATFGGILFWIGRKDKNILGKREGFFIVSIIWVIYSFAGMLPYIFSGAIPNITDAFFETISGYTTCGATILNNIEGQSKSILFWRSLTQWIGGMGIIVLTIAILPMLGGSSMKLFGAEASGISIEKLRPHIADTARHLWGIYVVLTLIQTVLLWLGPMDLFDALCHSFTTLASGGYSTKQASIAYWDSAYVEYVIILFMIIAGMNFGLIYHFLHKQREKLYKNEEFRWYLYILFGSTLMIALGLWLEGYYTDLEYTFRVALFQIASIMTTTGYATADYTLWGGFFGIILLVIMFIGSSAGSTAGGIKVVRLIVFLKNLKNDFQRQVHPNAIIPVRLQNEPLTIQSTNLVLSFITLYIIVFAFGSIVLTIMGLSLEEALGASMTSLSVIGPGLGKLGPCCSFSEIPDAAKWVLSFLMLAGRLELFTLLLLFTPFYWKK